MNGKKPWENSTDFGTSNRGTDEPTKLGPFLRVVTHTSLDVTPADWCDPQMNRSIFYQTLGFWWESWFRRKKWYGVLERMTNNDTKYLFFARFKQPTPDQHLCWWFQEPMIVHTIFSKVVINSNYKSNSPKWTNSNVKCVPHWLVASRKCIQERQLSGCNFGARDSPKYIFNFNEHVQTTLWQCLSITVQ
jgi:hypothetical protein